MFLTFQRGRDPFYTESQRCHPLRQCHRRQDPVNNLLAPAMYFLQQLARPDVVTPKQQGSKDSNKFEMRVDVKHFSPEELSVKMVDNCVVIEGKYEEKQDDEGYISRQFVRRFKIPEDVKQDDITSNLSSDGFLVISAPRVVEGPTVNERTLPINFTGQPAPVQGTECGESEG